MSHLTRHHRTSHPWNGGGLSRERTLVIGILLLLLNACATQVPLPEVSVIADPKAAWARTLAEYVDDRGRIDFVGVAAEPHDLETWIAYVAKVSPRNRPELFPTLQDRLAYYIDAYNGLVMYGVIRSGAIPRQKIRFFHLRRYLVGNEEMSLNTLENDVIRPLGDARVHFALNDMVKSSPRLPQVPWDATILDDQLQAAALEYFNAPYDVQVDEQAQQVQLSELMDQYEEDFLKEAPSLLGYVNRFRRQPVPTDYQVEFIPFNWKLNRQPRT